MSEEFHPHPATVVRPEEARTPSACPETSSTSTFFFNRPCSDTVILAAAALLVANLLN